MVETVPVDIYEGDYRLYIESLGELFIEVSNSVHPDPSKYWQEDEDGVLQVTTNESTANFTQQYLVDMGEKVEDNLKVELVKRGGTHYLLGQSENIPAYYPFYVYHTETEEIYEVLHGWGEDFAADSFIGEPSYEESVLVKNVRTEQSRPLDKETFERQLETGLARFALPL